MPSADRNNIPRNTSKRARFLALSGGRTRPGLEVDTSFTQYSGSTPEQVYPPPNLPSRSLEKFVSLNDIKALSQPGPSKINRHLKKPLDESARIHPGPQKSVTRSLTQQSRALESAHAPVDEAVPPPYKETKSAKDVDSKSQAQFVLQDPPKGKRKGELARPAPPKLKTDISPSDRRIPIGIAISPGTVRNHKFSLESAASHPRSTLKRESSQRSTQGHKTPTIIITPAEEDFKVCLNGIPPSFRSINGHRPRSSVYSRYTNYTPERNEITETPPVPPLPSFAQENWVITQSNVAANSACAASDDASSRRLSSQHINRTASFCTEFDDHESIQIASATSSDSNRSSSQIPLPTPRRSKGWWNLIISPFSAASASRSFFPSSSPVPEEEQLSSKPVLSNASSTPLSGNTRFRDQVKGKDELRSAPPTECSRQTFASRGKLTPKRSDTAPAALDLGNADAINIYRIPSHGSASSYYDRSRSYSGFAPALPNERLDEELERGWSPSQSVYRGSRSLISQAIGNDDRGFANMTIPTGGEAEPYYDTTKRFPSIDEPEFASIGISHYRTTQAASPPQRGVASLGVPYMREPFVESPTTFTPSQVNFGNDSDQPSGTPSRGLQNERLMPLTNNSTFANSRMAGDACNAKYPPHPKEAEEDMVLDADIYPTNAEAATNGCALGGSSRDDNEVSSSLSREKLEANGTHAPGTSLSSGWANAYSENFESRTRDQSDLTSNAVCEFDRETPIVPLTSGKSDGTLNSRPSAQYWSPVEENASSASYRGTLSSNGEPRQVDIARERQLTGTTNFSSNDSRNDSRGFKVIGSPSEANLSNFADPFIETGEKGRLRPDDSVECNNAQDYNAGRSCYRKFFSVLAPCAIIFTMALVILVFMFVPFNHADMPVQAQWLNLTGFPPLPTGVATVIGAKSVKDVNGCVSAKALWSCAVPPGQRSMSTTNANEPNFRFLIRFRNGTMSNETLLEPMNTSTIKRGSGRAANAGALVKRSAWSDYIYSSSPSPPTTEDQIFLGRTSEQVSSPYNGEETPFYISLLDPVALKLAKRSALRKRDFRYPYPTPSDFNSSDSGSNRSDSNSSATTASHSAAKSIPLPALQWGGDEPAPPELYPFATAQPLRLFNRGQQSEHYGFYTYFDRSIFISSLSNDTSARDTIDVGSLSGNVRRDHATAVCTWSQSRLLVQIWTGKPDVTALYPTKDASSIPAVNSTANDMKSPGSFPYAITITLDRHGGDASKKGVYCYGLDEDHHVEKTMSTWIAEDRGFDGKIVNPAEIPINNGSLQNGRNDGQGDGIDGGTGGCACQWQNFS